MTAKLSDREGEPYGLDLHDRSDWRRRDVSSNKVNQLKQGRIAAYRGVAQYEIPLKR